MRLGLGAVVIVGTLMLVGSTAEAQGRGTLQATATVVDTHQGFGALAAVRQTLTDSRTQSQSTVATVAQITTDHPVAEPRTIVVTVDFSRN